MEKAPRKRPFIEAKFKAQKLAFAPLTFQAAIAMRDLGILAELDRCKEVGITAAAMVDVLKLTPYAVETLLEVGVSAELVQRNDDKYTLSTVGYFVLHDKMTRIHTDFVNDVCYKGAHALKESFQTSKPAGLKEFGDWPTIYDGLSALPKGVQKVGLSLITSIQIMPLILRSNWYLRTGLNTSWILAETPVSGYKSVWTTCQRIR